MDKRSGTAQPFDKGERPKIHKSVETFVEVEVPEGYEPCQFCKGRGRLSKYDEGWTSIVPSRDLAALRECRFCNGEGFRRAR